MFFSKDKKAMQECLTSMQESNKTIAATLAKIVEPKQEIDSMDPWRAVYALNLCTVSVSQIVETNDMRFMEREYENILNNLNLEMMPKDEALLDILKQILDVINYFKIQSREKELLDKEYQQKLKDAVWSAVPNPSVILAGGQAGWIGLAVSAAVTVGTSYMNYRKEKANINNEQERKNWELERSAMEQLHGLQRQLFETAWRLADKYKFDDNMRLTERQIKQYLSILTDTNDLRRFNRLEYIEDEFEAYPPYWYYRGSAALQFAYTENCGNISVDYYRKAKVCFEKFFEKSQKGNRLLREDPVVAQCAFEYVAVMNKLKENGGLQDGEYDEKKLIKILDDTVEASGNALDVLQQCAMNYLALNRNEKAIRIMKALVNEQYNMYSNIQILSVLYVEQYLTGALGAKTDYELIKRDHEDHVYPFITDLTQKETADQQFLRRQKIQLAKRFAKAMDIYLDRVRDDFADIVSKDYDITEDVIGFFYRIAGDFNELFINSNAHMTSSIESFLGERKGTDYLSQKLNTKEHREELKLDAMLDGFVKDGINHVINIIGTSRTMRDLSAMESKLFSFCEKQDIMFKSYQLDYQNAKNRKSIEGVLLGSDIVSYKEKKSLLDKYLKIVNDPKYKDAVVSDESEVEFLVDGDPKMVRYKLEKKEKLQNVRGDIFAVIRDQKSSWFVKRDLVFTTAGVFVVGSCDVKHDARYSEISSSDNNTSLIKIQRDAETKEIKSKEIYDQPGLEYKLLNEMLLELKKVESSETKYTPSTIKVDSINAYWIISEKIRKW